VGFVSPALSYGAKPKNFYQSLDRFEFMFASPTCCRRARALAGLSRR